MSNKLVLIPEERKPILIGRSGRAKASIEKATSTKITVGDGIEIEGNAADVMMASDIVLAIGRGFPPNEALALSDEEYCLYTISLGHMTDKEMKREVARVIGREGGARKRIEKETDARIRVYGKTISIIGKIQEVERASNAIELLLEGKTHAYVFSRLKRGK
jgi:ribosomal RNA assembly protein